MVENCLVKTTMSFVDTFFAPNDRLKNFFLPASVMVVGTMFLRRNCAWTSSLDEAVISPDSIVPSWVFPDH